MCREPNVINYNIKHAVYVLHKTSMYTYRTHALQNIRKVLYVSESIALAFRYEHRRNKNTGDAKIVSCAVIGIENIHKINEEGQLEKGSSAIRAVRFTISVLRNSDVQTGDATEVWRLIYHEISHGMFYRSPWWKCRESVEVWKWSY